MSFISGVGTGLFFGGVAMKKMEQEDILFYEILRDFLLEYQRGLIVDHIKYNEANLVNVFAVRNEIWLLNDIIKYKKGGKP